MRLVVGLFASALLAVIFCLNPNAFCDAPANCTGQKPQGNVSNCVNPGWTGCNNFYNNDPCPASVGDDPNCEWQNITVGQGYWNCVAGDPSSDICLDNVTSSLCFQNNHCYMNSNGRCVPAGAYPCNIVMNFAKRNPPCTDPNPGT